MKLGSKYFDSIRAKPAGEAAARPAGPTCQWKGCRDVGLYKAPVGRGHEGKYYLFWATVEADLMWLAILGVVTSVVSAFFYLRVVVAMYFDAPDEAAPVERYAVVTAALIATSAGTLVLGLWPQPLLDLAQSSVWPILSHSAGF